METGFWHIGLIKCPFIRPDYIYDMIPLLKEGFFAPKGFEKASQFQ